MTEERLKEIKDSIDFQLDVCKITEQKLPNILALEEKELYDEVINLKEENERLKKELNKHIKEGIEKDAEIKEQNDDIEWWTNRFNAVERDKREYKTRIDKAIEYIKNNKLCICKEDEGMIFTAFVDKELLNILQGSDKE